MSEIHLSCLSSLSGVRACGVALTLKLTDDVDKRSFPVQLNCCVNEELQLKALTASYLVQVINRYKDDIVEDDIDRAILCTDDLEPFLRYKYPILRLSRHFTEEKDSAKKVYIMTSVLLYHCCISSHTGAVENDICSKLHKEDREMILRFCESLSDMEITINNVDVAIEKACEFTPKAGPSNTKKRSLTPHVSKSAVADMVSETESIAVSDVSSRKMRAKKVSTLTFKSSVTVMPSRISVVSYSKTSLHADSSLETSDTCSMKLDDYSESTTVDSVAVFNIMEKEPELQLNSNKPEKSRRDAIDNSSICTDDTVITITSRSKKDSKSTTGLLSIRSSESRDSKVERYKDSYRKPPEAKPIGLPMGNKKYSPEAVGDQFRLKREVCFLPVEPQADTSVSSNEPCNCVVSSSDYMSDSTNAKEMPECKARADIPAEKPKKKDISVKKRSFMPRVQTMFCSVLFQGGKDKEGSKKGLIWVLVGVLFAILVGALTIATLVYSIGQQRSPQKHVAKLKESDSLPGRRFYASVSHPGWAWQCSKSLCMKVYKPMNSSDTYPSLSRCILLCSGPQLWPYPIGMTYFSKQLVGLATDRLEYKFQAVPSDMVNQYLAEAFKLFLGDLSRLERVDRRNKNRTQDIEIKKMHVTIEVESDSDPRIRVNTDESYYLKILEEDDRVKINVISPSFAGVRHGLETLSQIILLDQSTGHLITLTEVILKDAPSYKYRGLMLDTARNYIPVQDILRTIDGMATCKLNTFHWRITDSASFPLYLPSLSNLFEYGAYDRAMIYTKHDVKAIVNRAAVKGIRVLMEVAIPGPVGRAWSWSDDATCPRKNDNFTCDNVVCLRLKMQRRVFELLQHLYSEIIDMTNVDDIFHLSDSVFSLSNCYYLIDEREGFLEKALERLRRANKGFLPKLPIIWYTQHLNREMEAKTWERYGVQVYEWPSHPDRSLRRYKVIHSGRWDLSCDIKKQRCTKYRSWQEMYGWKSWQNIEVFSIEGGEAMLWTDLVDSGNLDFHLWPRTAAVAERLWSDLVANSTAGGDVYIRLDNHRWRMLLRGLQVAPVWPVWCSFNPAPCLSKLIKY